MSESQSALYLMALTTPMLVFPSVAALLTRWFSPGQVSTAGLMMASVGLLLLGDAFHSNHLPQLVLALILCGAGRRFPGLMDGPAISAVPVAKAGMAAGLFNTVRVAGEGIALAVVSAVLTASNTLTLQSRVHGYAPEVIHRAAGWLGPAICRRRLRFCLIFPSGCCARAMTLLIRYCLAGWRSSPCCAP